MSATGRYLRRDLGRAVRFAAGGAELPATVERVEVFGRGGPPDVRLVLTLDYDTWTRVGDTAAFGVTLDSLSPRTPSYALVAARPIELTVRVDASLVGGASEEAAIDAIAAAVEAGRPELLDAMRHRWLEVMQALAPGSPVRMGARSKDADA